MYEELLSKTGMSLDRLRVLCEVIRHGTIAGAVDRDPSRASHYSRQIAELEEYFGVKLFMRKNRRLIPTPHALQLETIARNFFVQLEDLSQDIKGRIPTLRIGAQESVIKWFLVPHLADWQAQFRDVKFDLQNHRTSDMIDGLTEGQLDLAVIREEALTSDLTSEALCLLDYGLFIPRALRASLPKRISVSILRGLPLATLSHHGRFASHLNDLQDDLGEELNIRATCNSFSLITEIMKIQQLATILPMGAARDLPRQDFHCVQPAFLSPFERTLVLAYLRNPHFVRPFARNVAIVISRTLRNASGTG
jgi:DNA-binding transcriptional LysR family regulator